MRLKPAQRAECGAVRSGTARQPNLTEAPENADLLASAGACDAVQTHSIAPRGFEQSPLTPPKTVISEKRGAESGALDGDSPDSDPDLARLVGAWPDLPDEIKQTIMTLVRKHAEDSPDAPEAE